MGDDLRQWLARVEAINALKRVDAVHWNLEIGCVAYLGRASKNSPAFL